MGLHLTNALGFIAISFLCAIFYFMSKRFGPLAWERRWDLEHYKLRIWMAAFMSIFCFLAFIYSIIAHFLGWD